MERTPRKTVKLSDSVQRRLNSYALAAGAAGVGVLALAQTTQAKIVYTAAHKQLPINKAFYLDLNHDRINDFKFFLGTSGNSSPALFVYPARQGNGIWSGQNYGINCAYALPKGTRIGPKRPFGQNYAIMFLANATNTYCPWGTLGKKQAYLGLKFSVKGKVHFGWARFVTHTRPNPTAELTGYAYETIPGKPIIAGATNRPDDAEPTAAVSSHTSEPATLGALALGAPGLSIWRRKESAAAALAAN
jgi:hypothetical protein